MVKKQLGSKVEKPRQGWLRLLFEIANFIGAKPKDGLPKKS